MKPLAIPLRSQQACDRALCGGKAAAVAQLLQRGLPVPPGFVIPDVPAWLRLIERKGIGGLPPGYSADDEWLVRSSSQVEDGLNHSYAGRFASLRAEPGLDGLLRACEEVSCAATAVPVVVQRYLASALSGVLFTSDPLGRHRGRFVVDGSRRPEAITGGTAGSQEVSFDPLHPRQAELQNTPYSPFLDSLVECAFLALDVFGPGVPLDLEWLVDEQSVLWIVQARPVTAARRTAPPGAARLREEGYAPVTARPVCRLSQELFQDAAQIDRRAGRFHHAHFDRVSQGPWLWIRRRVHHKRLPVAASDPWTFLARWLWVRRRNLAFGLYYGAAWLLESRLLARRSRETLSAPLSETSDRSLFARVWTAARDVRIARRLHAALWYPVDLVKDAQAFHDALRTRTPPSVPPPWRTAREHRTEDLLSTLRSASQGKHRGWNALSPEEKRRVQVHLACFPFAFENATQVQDLSTWKPWNEEAPLWWERQAAVPVNRARVESESPKTASASQRSLPERILDQAQVWCSGIKDDRVELLALAQSALQSSLAELERRLERHGLLCASTRAPVTLTTISTRAAGSWTLELDTDELRLLLCDAQRPEAVQWWKALGVARHRFRLLEAQEGLIQDNPRRRVTDVTRPAIPGRCLAAGCASGTARRIESLEQGWERLKPGEVLVVEELRPVWAPLLSRAAAVVCRQGSSLSHGAILAREAGIPAVALESSLDRLPEQSRLEVDGTAGLVRILSAETTAVVSGVNATASPPRC